MDHRLRLSPSGAAAVLSLRSGRNNKIFLYKAELKVQSLGSRPH